MLRSSRIFKTIAAVALVLLFIIPDFPVSAPLRAKAAASISLNNVVLKPGKTKKISVEGDGTGFTWTSSNTAVAKVTRKVKADNTATITAKGEGVAVITATKGKNVYTCSVVVMETASTEAPEGEKATTSKGFKDITVFDKDGTVSVLRGKKTTLKATKNMKLKNDDFTTVGADSFLRLCMDDDSYTYFESGCEFAVSKGWFSKIKVCMTKGEMIVEVQKKLKDNDSYTVITPNTSMSIRGTVVAIKTVPEKKGQTTTYNYVLEGTAVLTTKDKKEITLKAGEGWQTTTSKKGKIVSSKQADASHFDFKDIDLKSLKGADGNELVFNGIELPEDPAGQDNEADDPNGTSEDETNTGENPEDGVNEAITEAKFERAVPAVFDYDKDSVVIVDSKESQPNESSFIEKDYDIFGVLRHKTESVESYSDKAGMSFTYVESYYDSNGTLRIKRTERNEHREFFDQNGQAGANVPEFKESLNVQELYYNSSKVLILKDTIDDTGHITIWYDDQGREAEYMKMTADDEKVLEHYYYAYDQNGNKQREE